MSKPARIVKRLKAPNVITARSNYIMKVEKLLQLSLLVHDTTVADITPSHSRQRTHGFFVNALINLV